MSGEPRPEATPVTSTQVLRDYLYGRLRGRACLSLSDRLLGLAMLSRESLKISAGATPASGEPGLEAHLIGRLKGYLLNGHCAGGDSPADRAAGKLRGRVASFKA